ncbi:hypothetical protein CA983_21095 [Streptomyces swartbergensis]|uniref:PAS domain-containing protein n=1 Tax=Streptomyces swartbergensis TaxID=487165 RepID=A0A243S182_9ACTN|nr:hypothetical protein CA983_21095 [Streptomyces swartbergensis]
MHGRVPEDLAVVVDARGLITVWSDGARRLLGYEPDEIVDRATTRLLAADLPGATRPHVADGQRWAGEVALRHRDGDRVVVRLQGTPMLAAAGPGRPAVRGRRGAAGGEQPARPLHRRADQRRRPRHGGRARPAPRGAGQPSRGAGGHV